MLGPAMVVAGIMGVVAFWFGLSVELGKKFDAMEPSGFLARTGVALMTWPRRFLSYRSGHGRHAQA